MLRTGRRVIPLLAFLALLNGCGMPSSSPSEESEPVKAYEMRGTVVRLQGGRTNIAVIKHENIDGWMEAMTMEFPVPSEAEFAKLEQGQTIAATVQVQGLNYWIENIRIQDPASAK